MHFIKMAIAIIKGIKGIYQNSKNQKSKKGKLQYKTKTISNGFEVHCSIQLVIKTTQIIYIYDVML